MIWRCDSCHREWDDGHGGLTAHRRPAPCSCGVTPHRTGAHDVACWCHPDVEHYEHVDVVVHHLPSAGGVCCDGECNRSARL